MKRNGFVRQLAGLMGIAAAFALGCAGSGSSGEGSSSAKASSAGARKDISIMILDEIVQPQVAHVAAGGSVAWNNDASSFVVVVFPKSLLKDLACKDVRPDWQYESDALVSIPAAADAPDVVLPCALKPGEYAYKVRYFSDRNNMDNPQRTNDAKIVVE